MNNHRVKSLGKHCRDAKAFAKMQSHYFLAEACCHIFSAVFSKFIKMRVIQEVFGVSAPAMLKLQLKRTFKST